MITRDHASYSTATNATAVEAPRIARLDTYDDPAFFTMQRSECFHPSPYRDGGGYWKECNIPVRKKPAAKPLASPPPPAQKAPRVEVAPPAQPAPATPDKPSAVVPPPNDAIAAIPGPVAPPAPTQSNEVTTGSNAKAAVIGQLNALSSDVSDGKYVFYSDMAALLAGVILTVLLVRRAIIAQAYYGHALQEAAVRKIGTLRQWLITLSAEHEAAELERQKRAEWKRLERMPPARFNAFLKRRDAKIAQHHSWATRLDDQAERIEASSFSVPFITRWRIDFLRRHSEKYAAAALAMFDDAERAKVLYADIEAARAVKSRDKAIADVRYLLGLLRTQSDAVAKSALTKLRRHRDIDWTNALRNSIAGSACTTAAKYLSLITGTDNINEARNALDKLLAVVGPEWIT